MALRRVMAPSVERREFRFGNGETVTVTSGPAGAGAAVEGVVAGRVVRLPLTDANLASLVVGPSLGEIARVAREAGAWARARRVVDPVTQRGVLTTVVNEDGLPRYEDARCPFCNERNRAEYALGVGPLCVTFACGHNQGVYDAGRGQTVMHFTGRASELEGQAGAEDCL